MSSLSTEFNFDAVHHGYFAQAWPNREITFNRTMGRWLGVGPRSGTLPATDFFSHLANLIPSEMQGFAELIETIPRVLSSAIKIQDWSEEAAQLAEVTCKREDVDLTETVREELVLSVSDYTLCRDTCKGLCPRCGADRNTDSCNCEPEPDPRWAGLEALRGALPGNEDE